MGQPVALTTHIVPSLVAVVLTPLPAGQAVPVAAVMPVPVVVVLGAVAVLEPAAMALGSCDPSVYSVAEGG